MRVFNLRNIRESLFSDEQKKRLRKLLKEVPRGYWLRPFEYENFLKKVDNAISGYGVETVRAGNICGGYFKDAVLLYVNKGDSYSETVMFETVKQKLYIGSVGSFIEYNLKQYDIL